MDLCCGSAGGGAFRLDWRRRGGASVGLAIAVAVRLAASYLLAGSRAACPLPDSVRELWRSWPRSFPFAAKDQPMLGTDDARGARETQPGGTRTRGRHEYCRRRIM